MASSKSRYLEVTLAIKDSDTEEWQEYGMVKASEQTFHLPLRSTSDVVLGIEEISQSVRAQVAAANRQLPLPKAEEPPESGETLPESSDAPAPDPDLPF